MRLSKAVVLFKALEQGKILYRDHRPDRTDGAFIEYLIYDKTNKILEGRGWKSALGEPRSRLESILKYPEEWHIHSHVGGYPYPWSTAYKKKP